MGSGVRPRSSAYLETKRGPRRGMATVLAGMLAGSGLTMGATSGAALAAAPGVPASERAARSGGVARSEEKVPPEREAAVDCRRAKCVALTFDDGPGEYTGELLRHLALHHARATFFVVGQNVVEDPAAVRHMVAAGHEIGNHTWSHRDLTSLSAAEVRAELARTDQAVKAVTGLVPKIIRPPYGALNEAVRAQTTRPMIMWSVDTLDWRHRDTARVLRTAVKAVRPGDIILFHDIHATTVAAIPRVLKGLSAQGYRFVTVSRLFDDKPPSLAYDAVPDTPSPDAAQATPSPGSTPSHGATPTTPAPGGAPSGATPSPSGTPSRDISRDAAPEAVR